MKYLGRQNIDLVYDWAHLKWNMCTSIKLHWKSNKERFNMDNSNPLATPMIVRSTDVKRDPYRPWEEFKEIVVLEVQHFSVIGAFMYLVNCARPDIAFVVNCLERFSLSPTKRYWNGIKHVLRCLWGTTDTITNIGLHNTVCTTVFIKMSCKPSSCGTN